MLWHTLIALSSGFLFALAFLFMNRAQSAGVKRGNELLAVTLINLTCTLVIFGFQFGGGLFGGVPTWDLVAIGWFVVAGLLSSFGGRYTVLIAMKHIGPSRAASFKSFSPVVAALAGWLWLGQSLDNQIILATLLLGVGLWLLNGQLKGKQSVIDSGANLALGWTFGAASAACWGLGYIARRLGLESMASPIVGVIIGALLTSVILITMNYKSRGLPLRLSYFGPPTSRMPMLLAGLFSTGGQIAAFTALHLMENTAIAVILISLDSLFMLLFSRFVIGKSEVITPLSFVYMLIALSGCALAILH
ncbi:MAG: EamA family transporter [Immundisolibacteraceae bacterium]|nr:EamA family transporter [Immundisolibacteraceae bacterium]